MNPTYYGPSTKYFNAYALMNAKGIYEGQRDYNPEERVFILTRSGFAGMQRYGTVTWSGDVGTVWEDLKAQITAGVNFSMSGMPTGPWILAVSALRSDTKWPKRDRKT